MGRDRHTVYDYLTALYVLGGKPQGAFVSITALARSLGVRKATAAVMVKRLEARGLAERRAGRGARLTGRGLLTLAKYAWKVGVLEHILARAGLEGEALGEVARRIAHSIRDSDARLLCASLGHPTRCPHGLPLPHPCEGRMDIENSCAIIRASTHGGLRI